MCSLNPTNSPNDEITTFATPSRTLFALPYWIAAHKGFFRAEGIETRLEIIADGNRIRDQLRAGATALAIDSPASIMLDALHGGPLRIVAGNACRPPLFLVTRRDITSVEQLKGARFGVLSLQEGSSKFIVKMLEAAGITPGEYRIDAVGGAPARAKLMIEGSIDACLQPMPLHYEAEAAGLNCLAWAGTCEPDWQFTSFNTNIEWARREPQCLVGILRAFLKAQEFMETHAAEAAAIAAEELHTKLPLAVRALKDAASLGIFNPKMVCQPAPLSRVFRDMQSSGLIAPDATFSMEQFVAADYLREAQASLGACRALGIDSEKEPQRGQFLPDLQTHSPAMGQKAGEKWTAAALLQPMLPKSDRLLDRP